MLSIHAEKFNGNNRGAYGAGWKIVNEWELENVAGLITGYVWSPCVWETGIRKREEFSGAHFCVLDFDEGATLETAQEMFADYSYILGTTRNHQKEKDGKPPCDRFRVVLFFDAFLTDVTQFEQNMKHYIQRFGSDNSTSDGARLYYPCRGIVRINYGTHIVALPLKKERVKKNKSKANGLPTSPSVFLKQFKDVGAYEKGTRNQTVFKAAAELTRHGLELDDIVAFCLERTDLEKSEVETTCRNAFKNEHRQT